MYSRNLTVQFSPRLRYVGCYMKIHDTWRKYDHEISFMERINTGLETDFLLNCHAVVKTFNILVYHKCKKKFELMFSYDLYPHNN